MLEFEALLKLFLAEHDTKADVSRTIAAIRAWAGEQPAANVAFARLYHDTGGPFPERLAPIVLTGRFLVDLADMVAAWSDWAETTVADWPEDITAAEPDWTTLDTVTTRPAHSTRQPTAGSTRRRGRG